MVVSKLFGVTYGIKILFPLSILIIIFVLPCIGIKFPNAEFSLGIDVPVSILQFLKTIFYPISDALAHVSISLGISDLFSNFIIL